MIFAVLNLNRQTVLRIGSVTTRFMRRVFSYKYAWLSRGKQSTGLFSFRSPFETWSFSVAAKAASSNSLFLRFLELPSSATGGGRSRHLRIPPSFPAKNGHLNRCPFLAGPAGFEPTDDGVKVRCLTAWRRPIIKIQPHRILCGFGDPSEIRTPDTLIKSQVLCQLS